MTKILEPYGASQSARRFHGTAMLIIVLSYLAVLVIPQRSYDIYLAYGRAAIIAAAAIYFWNYRLSGGIEVRLVIYYAAWVLISRILNTDYYLQNELDLVITRFLCAVVLPVGVILEREERERLLDVLIAVSGAFFLVGALLGIYACVFGVYFYVGPESTSFGIDSSYLLDYFYYVVAFGTNRTVSAVWFYLELCFMVYEFFKCRNKLWRIPICLAGFVFYLTIGLCFCRSIKFAVCINAAMLVVLGIMGIKKKLSPILKLVLMAAASLAVMVCVYKSFDVLNSGLAAIYNSMDVQIERTSDAFMMPEYFDTVENGQTLADTRDLGKSVSNMSLRGEIFASVIPTMKLDPMRLVIGKYSSKIMDIPRQFMSYPFFHMHNYLIQVLMLTGILGFALVLVFSVLIVVKCIRYFFSSDEKATLHSKMLIMPLAGYFMYGMMEVLMFTLSADDRAPTDFRELVFFLLCGIFLGYYKEVFPGKKKNV